MTLLDFGYLCVWFPANRIEHHHSLLRADWEPSLEASPELPALGSALCLAAPGTMCLGGCNEDGESAPSAHSARVGRREVEVAFPRINCVSEVVGKPSPAYGHFWLKYRGT